MQARALTFSNAQDDASPIFYDNKINHKPIEEQQLSAYKTPLPGNKILALASSISLNRDSNYSTQTFINLLDFVAEGGKVVSTGLSTMPPALLNGSNSPVFYSFSGINRPYGSAAAVDVTITNQRIADKLGTNTMTLLSSQPRSEHQLISNPKNNQINAIATYAIQQLVTTPLGDPYIDAVPVVVPVSIEYNRGVNGGQVIYSNTELLPNFEAGGLQKAYVEALLEPIFHKEDDNSELESAMGGNFYKGPSIISGSLKHDNLNMVVYRGYLGLGNSVTNQNKSFLFMIGKRRVASTAPQIDSSGDPELIMSMYTPLGDLYATKKALPGDFMVAINVPTTDNIYPGEWKYTVDEVHGFDGDRVVLAAVIDGIYEMYDPDWPDGGNNANDIIMRPTSISKTFTPKSALRQHGMSGDVYHHQLGYGAKTMDVTASRISFGGLISQTSVSTARIGDDLVFYVKGVRDKVTVPGWFTSKLPLSVYFEHDGTSWNSSDIVRKAVLREPERIVYVVSNDEYIAAGEGRDILSGHDDRNTHFSSSRGDNTVMFGKKGNILYYRHGDGNDMIIGAGDEGSYRAIHFHTDIVSADVTATRTGKDMVISVPDGSITVKSWCDDPMNRIDSVNFFSDGTALDTLDVEKLAAGIPLSQRETIMTFDERLNVKHNADDYEASDSSSGGCTTGMVIPLFGAILGVFAVLRSVKHGMARKTAVLLLTTALSAMAVLPASAETLLTQKSYRGMVDYSDISNFSIDNHGNFYVVSDKSLSATLVRFDNNGSETGRFKGLTPGIETLRSAPSGNYTFYNMPMESNHVYRYNLTDGTDRCEYGFTYNGIPVQIKYFIPISDEEILLAWDESYKMIAEYPNWLPETIMIGKFLYTSPGEPVHTWTWTPEWDSNETNFDGDPSAGKLGDSWGYKITYSARNGIMAYTQHFDKFKYEPTGKTHYSRSVTHIYAGSVADGVVSELPASNFQDWGQHLQPFYTDNGELIYGRHDNYEGKVNFIDRFYLANQTTKTSAMDKYVESWLDDKGNNVLLKDAWENPSDTRLDVAQQCFAINDGFCLIQTTKNTESGSLMFLEFIGFGIESDKPVTDTPPASGCGVGTFATFILPPILLITRNKRGDKTRVTGTFPDGNRH